LLKATFKKMKHKK